MKRCLLGWGSCRLLQKRTSNAATGSTLQAGGDLTITATGAGEQSDITVRGSDLAAGKNLTLKAEDEIKLLAAANTAEQHSTNKSSSASVGFSVGTNGFLVNVGASAGKGKADGADLAWTNSHATAGETLTLQSGGDTTLEGAVAQGEQVVAKVGGDLKIESLQDTSTYDSEQKSAGFSVSVGAGRVGGSVSYSQSDIESDYASVSEQSGIKAGDEGFQVKVEGNTDLKGAVIASSQSALDAGKNEFETGGTLSTEDIQNHAEYEANSTSVSLGTSISFDGTLKPGGTSAGFGQDGDSAESTTKAGISGVAGNTDVRTGDPETGIAKIFDAEKVQKEIEAQTKITQLFGQQASKAVGDYAASQLKVANELRLQGREEEAKAIEALWDETGTLRIAAHTVIGGLTGGASGAAGSLAGTITAPLVAEELAKAGITGNLATAITAIASTAVGGAVGGATGAGTALNEVANNYLKHAEAIRMAALQTKKLSGQCDTTCQKEIDALEQIDEQRNAVLDACQGVSNTSCNAARQEVRYAAAEYIRKNLNALNPGVGFDLHNTYAIENGETRRYADETLNGKTLGVAIGATGTVVDSVKAVVNVGGNLLSAAFGDEASQQALKTGASSAWDYVKNPDNWPYLLGAMTPEQREQLALAYEKGDGYAVGRIMGEQTVNVLSNLPSGGAAGTIKTVKAADKIEDAASVLAKVEKAEGDLSQAAIRARVEANLADSAAARASSNFNTPKVGLPAREWPPYPGSVNQVENDFVLLPGSTIDRFGPPQGTFLSPVGTPYSARALKPGTMADEYYVYEVLKPLPVKAGEIRPWFGEAGGGTQFRLDAIGGTRRTPSTLTIGDNPYLKEIFKGKYSNYE